MDVLLGRARGLGVLALLMSVACGTGGTTAPPPRGDGGPGADGGSDGGEGEGGRPDAGDDDALPTVRITSHEDGDVVGAGTLRIEGEASDDRAMSAVQVRVGPNVAARAQSDDNFKHFWFESPVPEGEFEVVATAIDSAAQQSEPAVVTLEAPRSGSDAAPPSITLTAPEDGSKPAQSLALVTGTTEDDRGVVAIEVELNGAVITERPVETSDFFATWARLVPLVPGEDNTLVFTARDAAGNQASASLTLEGPVETDRENPALRVDSPTAGATVDAAAIEVRGTAGDNVGVREVKVRTASEPSGTDEPDWGEYTFCETSDGFATWRCDAVALPLDAVVLEVKAIDLNGLVTAVELSLDNVFVPAWTDEVGLPLRIREPRPKPVLELSLDREGVNDVLNEEIQRDTRILELDTETLLTSALTQIKQLCGTDWQNDDDSPTFDCSAAFGPGWRTSPEFATVRILTMTPANVVVTGTSIEGLQELADNLNVGGGFRQILAQTLGIPRTQEIVGTAALVRSLQEFFMADHPAVLPGARLPVTLYDAMNDLAPLAETLGPAGSHPGIVDGEVYSQVFTDAFEMRLQAESNLVWKEGVIVSGASMAAEKEYIAVVSDDVGPSFDDVLEFDFEDPAKFDIQGLAPNPTVDLRFSLQEAPRFIDACLGDDPCQGNTPSSPLSGYVWDRPRWEAETVVAAGARFQYQSRNDYERDYFLIGFIPAATITVGDGDDPAGWATFSTTFNLGNPPQNQYLWELINEVAQVALHDTNGDEVADIAEGNANPAFTLSDIDVGLTADEIRDAVRPELQAQRAKLSEQILGDYAANNGAVDFYYEQGADGLPYIFFVAESDPLPGDSYDYAQPGFFAEPALTNKLSTTDAGTSGDSVHEKLRLEEGETTVYMRSATGRLHRLRFVVGADASEIEVFVSRRAG